MTHVMLEQRFNWLDIVFLIMIAASMLISLFRGFIKEIISLMTWAVAVWIGFVYSPKLAEAFRHYIENPTLRLVLAFVLLFIVVLIIGALVNILLSRLVKTVGLSTVDRMIGIIFGFIRGVILVAVVVLIGGLTNVAKEPFWVQSYTMPYFQKIANGIKTLLPAQVKRALSAEITHSQQLEKPKISAQH